MTMDEQADSTTAPTLSTSLWTTFGLFSKKFDERMGIDGSFGYVLIVTIFVIVAFTMKLTATTTETTKQSSTGDSSSVKSNHNPLGTREDDEPEPPRNFTLQQLSKFNGVVDERGNEPPVYLSVQGKVFDVSDGRDFYGPGGPYELFAGHECGIALAKMSFDTEHIDKFEFSILNHGEQCELDNWLDKFEHYRKYPVVGKCISPNKLPDSQRILSIKELANYDGSSDDIPEGYAAAPIYVGAGTKVFDVSFGGIGFYGKGGGYHMFAGKDASRALARMSFDKGDITNTSISDLTESQRKVLKDWINTFEHRKQYPIVGRLSKSSEETI